MISLNFLKTFDVAKLVFFVDFGPICDVYCGKYQIYVQNNHKLLTFINPNLNNFRANKISKG